MSKEPRATKITDFAQGLDAGGESVELRLQKAKPRRTTTPTQAAGRKDRDSDGGGEVASNARLLAPIVSCSGRNVGPARTSRSVR